MMRLLQLCSPGLPVGAYAYSEGLEQAVAGGEIGDRDAALDWVGGLLEHSVARLDVPLFARMHAAWTDHDEGEVRRRSAELLAYRETAELRAADRWIGQALARLLAALEVAGSRGWERRAEASFAALFALGCCRFAVPVHPGACGLAWTWAENLVTVAVKLVPLGQTDGQRILFALGERIPGACAAGLELADEDIGASAPGAAIASSRHERQRTRLFRS